MDLMDILLETTWSSVKKLRTHFILNLYYSKGKSLFIWINKYGFYSERIPHKKMLWYSTHSPAKKDAVLCLTISSFFSIITVYVECVPPNVLCVTSCTSQPTLKHSRNTSSNIGITPKSILQIYLCSFLEPFLYYDH